MNRLALLIGSDYDGLQGVRPDLVVMTEALRARGFVVRECSPAEATRSAILAAYEKLIDDVGPGDAVVVYYSGHGGSTGPPPLPAGPLPAGPPPTGPLPTGPLRPADLQYIVPIDYGESTADDFRGIAAAELSILQSRLVAVTRNVTVILDCCHSGLMSRDGGLRLRALRGSAPYAWVREHLDRMSLPLNLVPTESNPDAVRIVACAPGQRAFERLTEEGTCRGVLTDQLCRALAEAGETPVTWAALLDQIRYRVAGLMFEQRPEAEGPADRLLFTTEEVDLLNSLPVTPLGEPGRVRLDAAVLLRVQAGDEFVVMPPGRAAEDRAHRVADLMIDQVAQTSVEGPVTFATGRSAVPAGARAFRTRVTAPQIAVRVPVDHPRNEQVLAVLRTTVLARPAEPGEEWTAEIRFDEAGGVVLCDRVGPLHPPYPSDAQGFADLARAVLIHAQATQLRRLIADPTASLEADVAVEWGLVVDGAQHPPPVAGTPLTPGRRIYVTVHNRADVPVYVSMLDIGLSGRVSLLMRGTPSGRLLPPHRAYTYGRNDARQQLAGVKLSWPARLDPAHARTETILVVLTSAPQSLAALEQPGIVRSRSPGHGFRLRDMIDQIAAGGSREVDPDWSDGVRYEIHGIDFEMTPSLEQWPR
ncbi:caspase family protein [Micromonospora sp. NBC_01813]|uniref:caspase family protein n=1 Tax=Micromonospora sp. NBC_01813 TaxID=2975988 RepID=UPI002DDA8A55|nr:caspase family protein [Micromonospora sp. NBC_01813]WSA07530.1 caspase family protein [Micromonospora sp. NBC_01813]